MGDEWFVRVDGKEYGPVDLDTLREWQREGRLIPENELRAAGSTDWMKATQLVELFEVAPAPGEIAPHDQLRRRRSIGQLIGDAFGIYRRGFLQFFGLALLVAVPSFAMQVAFAFVHTNENGTITPESKLPATLAVVMLAMMLLAWPVFVAGLQFATADLLAGQAPRFSDLWRRAIGLWPRVAKLSMFVYGSFIFWTALPLIAVLAIAANGPSVMSLLLAMFALAVQVYMAGRLFVNFLFWQQSAALADLERIEALRDSKELARSRPDAPMLDRPLYRGALLASLWLLVLLAMSAAVELPFLFVRLQGVATLPEMVTLLQKLMNAPVPDALTITTYACSSLAHAALRPLLGIVFVLLYFDAKARL